MIVLRDVVKEYKSKNGPDVIGFQAKLLEFTSYGVVFLFGKSGSGKTTLLNLISGNDYVSSGSIHINGKDISKSNNRELANYRLNYTSTVFQEVNLINELNVNRNLDFISKIGQVDKKTVTNEEVLSKVNLSSSNNKYPLSLSVGQQKRIAISRAIFSKAKIVFLDEPTASLDEQNTKEVMELIKKVSKEKLIIISSHNKEVVKTYADRIVSLKYGKIISDETIHETSPLQYIEEKTFKRNMRYIFSTSFSRILKKPLSLILNAFLVSVLVTITVVFLLMQANYQKQVLESVYVNKASGLVLYNEFKEEIDGEVIDVNSPILRSEMDDLKEAFPHLDFYPVFYYYYSYITEEGISDNDKEYYNTDIVGFMELDDMLLKQSNLVMELGSIPTEDNQIVITKYHADLLLKYGSIELKELSEYSDFINKELTINENIYIISGIIDTNITSLYSSKNVNIFEEEGLSYEFEKYYHASLHDKIFFYEGHLQDLSGYEDSYILKIFSFLNDPEDTDTIVESENIQIFDSSSEITWFSDNSELDKNDIVTTTSCFNLNYMMSNNLSLNDNTINMRDQLVFDYAIDNHHLVIEDYNTPMKFYEDLISGFNVLESEKNLEYFWKEAFIEVVESELLQHLNNETLYLNNGFGDFEEVSDFSIIGVIYNGFSEEKVLYMHEERFTIINESQNNSVMRVFVPFKSENLDELQLELLDGTLSNLKTNNEVHSLYSSYTEIKENLKNVSLILIICNIIVLLILLFRNIGSSIMSRRDEIVTYKSQGLSNKDICFIFIVDNVYISAAVAIISLPMVILVVALLNNYFASNYGSAIAFITINILTALPVLFLSFAPMLIVTMIISKRILSKSTVEIMKLSISE